MSITGNGGGDVLWAFNTDSQGAVVAGADLRVTGTLRVAGSSTLEGGMSAPSVTATTLNASTLSVSGSSTLGSVKATSVILSDGLDASGIVAVNGNGLDSGLGRGFRFWGAGSSSYAMYMAQSGSGKSASGGIAATGGLAGTPSAFSSYAIRTRMTNDTTRGFILENSAEECAFSVRSDGHAYVRQSLSVNDLDCRGNITVNGAFPTGPPGAQGPPGDTGPAGAQGLQGETGVVDLTLLNAKADKSNPTFTGTVNCPSAAFVQFANVSLSTILGTKADLSYVDAADSALTTSKASVSYVDTAIGLCSTKSYVDSAIAQKFNNGYANSVNITACTLSDSFIVDTDNVSGEIEVQCTPAYNVEEITNELTKTTPWFSNATTPNANGVWPTTPWTITSRLNNNAAFNAINGTSVWTSSAAQSETTANVNEWWRIQFPAAVKIASYSWTNGGGRSLGFPGVWTLQYSNDGISFTIAGSYTAGTFQETGEKSTYAVDNYHPAATHWRLVITQIRSSGWVCTLSGIVFNTIGIFGAPTFLSARSTDFNTFKIIIVDLSGASVSMLNTTATWKFNVMITKGGKVVCAGNYQFSRNATTGFGVVTKISPTNSTVISVSSVENPSAQPDVVYPTPIGTILCNAGFVIPIGYLKCDGAAISRTTYANLYGIIGILWGVGDGTTTFNLPDLQDRFLRMTGPLGGEVGTKQVDITRTHTHTASSTNAGEHGHSSTIASGGSHAHTASSSSAGNHNHVIKQVSNFLFGNSAGSIFKTISQGYAQGDLTNDAGAHSHGITVASGGSHSHALTINNALGHTHPIKVDATGSTETRPVCATVNYVIKY